MRSYEQSYKNMGHKLSRFYVNNYDIIAVEALHIRNMVKNRRLAQKILDASWGKFRQLLAYKAENELPAAVPPWG